MGGTEVQALRDISFSLDDGEMTAVVGRSGSGKSTLLNVLGTLDRPNAGRYALDGTWVHELDEPALAQIRNERIGFVFQAFNLLPSYSALENVELPMVYSGIRASQRSERARAALYRVGLEDRVDHRPNELSGGQQQRVALARALVNHPRLLLADEPTGALDTRNAEQVLELFSDLHDEGTTILLVTHDRRVAEHADRVVTFEDGRIVSDTGVHEDAA
ncbi:MAG: ABC transporter ATP-binding protein [Myxococcota bacterium]